MPRATCSAPASAFGHNTIAGTIAVVRFAGPTVAIEVETVLGRLTVEARAGHPMAVEGALVSLAWPASKTMVLRKRD